MGITSIKRDQAYEPFIVRISTTDDLSTVSAEGYLDDQQENIQLINNGDFEWLPDDQVAIAYSDGTGLFSRDPDTGTLTPIDAGFVSNELPSAEIFVGNASNIATPRAMTGQIGISNTGLTTIAGDTVRLGQLNTGVRPVAIIKYKGHETTVGGSATEVFSATGCLPTDDLYCQMVFRGAANVNILTAESGTDQFTVVFSANPGNDAEFNWQLIRLAEP